MSLAARREEKRLYSQTTVTAKLVLISHFFRSDFSFPVISPPHPMGCKPLQGLYESVYGVSRKTQTITAESSGHNVGKKTFLSSIISDISLIHVTYFSSMVIVLVKFNLYLFLVL